MLSSFAYTVAMQTLGLADSTPHSESRVKALLWPSIQNATDVDYITTQGFWICIAFGVLNLFVGFVTGHEFFGLLVFLMYFLGGVGVREGSIVAAIFALLYYLVETIASGPGILRIICLALLFANLRAVWL